MSLTRRVIIALAAGLIVGIAISASKSPALVSIVSFLEPLGTLWVNAIRMTVIPLVVSLIIVGVASVSEAGGIGRLGARTLIAFLILLFVSAVVSVSVAPPLFGLLRIDPAMSASLRATAASSGTAAAESARQLPTFGRWLTELVPINPVKAAADGTMLPLVIFTLLFAVAVTHTSADKRETVIRIFKAVGDTMLILVRWIIQLAPIGVFVLALGLASRLGATAAGAVGFYVLAICGIFLLELLLLYPITVIAGGLPLREFAKAMSPVQAVAFSTRSSLATLPALIEAAKSVLRLPPAVSGFVLPLAVSTFKMTTPPTFVVSAVFIARLYGIELAPQEILAVAAYAIVLSFSSPGIPSGGLILLAPLFATIGLPVEGIGILIALDVFPDATKSMVNVTADMTVAAAMARGSRSEPVAADPD